MSNVDASSIGEDASKGKAIQPDKRAADEMALFEHTSQLQLKQVFHELFIFGLRVLGICGILILMARAWDMVAPSSCIWMTDTQIQSLDKVLVSGAFGGLIGRYFNQILPAAPPK
jgi:hypothetical protein